MSDALILALENTIERLKFQVSTLQAEKARLEGELGRLRKDAARYQELRSTLQSNAEKQFVYWGGPMVYLSRDYSRRSYAERLDEHLDNEMARKHPIQEPTNGI